MLDNVNDLLTKTRSEKGMLDMRWSEINMVEFVSRSLKVFEPFAAKQKNKLIFTDLLPANGSPETPRLYVDREKLKKILNNLVGNAMKFTKDGEIEIILDRTDTHCILKVRDTGPGIPKEDLGIIFDSFTQASNNTMKDVQGTGLGLAMVKDFTQKHGGAVTVESTLGKGSIFKVSLPLGDAHVDKTKLDTIDIVEEGDIRIDLGIKSFDEFDFTIFYQHDPKKHHILLVEDNSRVLYVLAYILKDIYNLHFARDGQEGLEKAQRLKPDLIVSDIMMPRLNGYELVRDLKADPYLRFIPVIMITSKADLDSKLKGFEEGVDEYLAKPFNNREVLIRIHGLIQRRKMEKERIQGLEALLAQAQTMADVGVRTGGMVHNIKNMLFPMAAQLDAIRLDLQDIIRSDSETEAHNPLLKEYGSGILEMVDNGEATITDIKDFLETALSTFRGKPKESEAFSLAKLVQHNIRLEKARPEFRNIQIHFETEGHDFIIEGLKGYLSSNIVELIKNAGDAIAQKVEEAHGNIWVKLEEIKLEPLGDCVRLSIRDDGGGMSDDIKARIFEHRFTTKGQKGTGLGLPEVAEMIRSHHGTMTVESLPGKESTFTITLPKHQQETIRVNA